jgi:beta-ketoacyl synthase-like protein/ketoacyl-synthetase-like protein
MGLLSRLQSFTHVQARRFARHPDCSYRNAYTLGSRGFYIRAYHGLLPPRAPDMLTVRFGQLTVRGLPPLKIRSLVGCSPNGSAQQALLRQALAAAAVAPSQVDYLETHGMGTALGDPIEVRSLDAVMCEGRAADDPLLIGSVKTNIGHLEAATGIAGLIKVVLALERGVIPASLHFHTPNPNIPWDESRVVVTPQRTLWPRRGKRRIAGVSSFGISGTNAHACWRRPHGWRSFRMR